MQRRADRRGGGGRGGGWSGGGVHAAVDGRHQRRRAARRRGDQVGWRPQILAAMKRDLGLERRPGDGPAAAGRSGRAGSRPGCPRRPAAGLRRRLATADAAVVVAVTDAGSADEVTAAGATPKLVDLNAAKLDAVKAGLDKAAAKAPPADVPGWYVDPTTNTVVVQARGATERGQSRFASGGDDTTRSRSSTTERHPEAATSRRRRVPHPAADSCSIGFSVNGGFVSAGHCGAEGTETMTSTKAPGHLRGFVFPGNDIWVRGGQRPAGPCSRGSTARRQRLPSRAPQAPIGSAVCRSGSNTGWRCGTMLAHNQTVTYPRARSPA